MIEQHPLAFLLGIEGVALLRAFAGEHDAAFTEARFAEIRRLLDMADEPFVALEPLSTGEAYDGWADSYDEPGNELVEIEQRVVWDMLETLPPGVAVDAACGTGRHAARLAELEPVFAEFVRVLKPGGSIVVSDRSRLQDAAGAPIVKATPDGRVGYVPEWNHSAGDYARAALAQGLRIVRCEEPLRPSPIVRDPDPPEHVPGSPANPWALMPTIADAANAAHHRKPIAIIWRFDMDKV